MERAFLGDYFKLQMKHRNMYIGTRIVTDACVGHKAFGGKGWLCLTRDGSGCLYTIIQWKTSTSVLQSKNWANITVEEKVGTLQ